MVALVLVPCDSVSTIVAVAHNIDAVGAVFGVAAVAAIAVVALVAAGGC